MDLTRIDDCWNNGNTNQDCLGEFYFASVISVIGVIMFKREFGGFSEHVVLSG